MSYNTFPTLQGLGWPVKATPKYKTIIQQAASGAEYRTGLWQTPLHLFEIPINFMTAADYATLLAFFNGQQGALIPFNFSPTNAVYYTATNYTFATPAGSTGPFPLSSPSGNMSSATVTAIYRTDWQSQQLLYTTPRTNYSRPDSEAFGGTYYTIQTGTTVTLNDAVDPRGTTTATLVDMSAAAVGSGIYSYSNGVVVNGAPNVKSIWLKGSAGGEQLKLVDAAASLSTITVTLTTAWARYELLDKGQLNGMGLWLQKVSGSSYYATFQQMELGTVATSYIPTPSGGPVTVTDYTLSGTSVTLGQVAATGATLQWTGTGYISQGTQYLVRFPDDLSFEQFMSQLYRTKTIKLQEVR